MRQARAVLERTTLATELSQVQVALPYEIHHPCEYKLLLDYCGDILRRALLNVKKIKIMQVESRRDCANTFLRSILAPACDVETLVVMSVSTMLVEGLSHECIDLAYPQCPDDRDPYDHENALPKLFYQKTPTIAERNTVLQCDVETSGDKALDASRHWRVEQIQHLLGKGDGVRIALLDSGLDVTHPDFARLNLKCKSFCDDHAFFDHTSHGTHCLGTLARIAPEADFFVGKVLMNIMALELLPGDIETLCAAIYYAVDEFQCHVLSMSCGTQMYNNELERAIRHAVSRNVVVVCAAANYGRLLQNSIAYPAAFGSVICVGAHSIHGQASAFSSAGREVDFVAPGEGIRSSFWGGKQGAFDGTSMATPFVAGLSALLFGFVVGHGAFLNCETMRALLRTTCSKDHTSERGYGVLDPSALVHNGADWIVMTLARIGVPLPLVTLPPAFAEALGTRLDIGIDTVGFKALKLHFTAKNTLNRVHKRIDSNGYLIGLIVCHFYPKTSGKLTKQRRVATETCAIRPGDVLLVSVEGNSAGRTAHLTAAVRMQEKYNMKKFQRVWRFLGFSITARPDKTLDIRTRSASLNERNFDDRRDESQWSKRSIGYRFCIQLEASHSLCV